MSLTYSETNPSSWGGVTHLHRLFSIICISLQRVPAAGHFQVKHPIISHVKTKAAVTPIY